MISLETQESSSSQAATAKQDSDSTSKRFNQSIRSRIKSRSSMKSVSKENKIKPFEAHEENVSLKSITISTISLNKPIKDLDVLSDLNKNLIDEEANQSEVDINNNNNTLETNCTEKNILLFKRSRKGDASEKQLTSRESSPENYEYLVTLRKVSSKNSNNSQRMSCVKPDALNSTAVDATVQESNELNEINLDEEYFNENLIKDVVSQCFDELSKNQTKIPMSHVTFKGKAFINI